MKRTNIILLITAIALGYLVYRQTRKTALPTANGSTPSTNSGDPFSMTIEEKKKAIQDWINGNRTDSPTTLIKLNDSISLMNDEELTVIYIYIFDYFARNVLLEPNTPIYSQFEMVNGKYRIF